jgi:hypothetical protein
MKSKLIIIIYSLVLAQCLTDAYYDLGFKSLSKVIELLCIGIWFFFTFQNISVKITNIIVIVASYLCLRFAIYDTLYNKVRGLNFDYCGSTTFFYDKILCPLKFQLPFIVIPFFIILSIYLIIDFYEN